MDCGLKINVRWKFGVDFGLNISSDEDRRSLYAKIFRETKVSPKNQGLVFDQKFKGEFCA